VGGTTGQVLAKASATNYDTAWVARNPFNQDLNTTDIVSFSNVNSDAGAFGTLSVIESMTFGDTTEQFTALPTGLADGYIVEWDADTNTYVSVPNDARTLFLNGTNKTGTTIAKGKAVYVSGATGNHPEITLAIATSEAASSKTIGITSEAIANNATGRVIVAGLLENVDTSAFTAGNVLYLSSSSAGGFQTTLPTQPNHGVLLGYVTRSNANNGVIEVRVDNYQELGEQSDVLLTSKTNLDLLSYETSSGLWKNKSFSTLGLLTSATAASTYAPLASPTFTGTVTIPAGASISGFAPLASPALTGTPTAPTAAATTNTTQVATTAFVQQEVPAASTTAAGKVELATDAETLTGTSTALAVTPFGAGNTIRSYLTSYKTRFTDNAWPLTTSSGTGATVTNRVNYKDLRSPTSVVGNASVGWELYHQRLGQPASAAIDWSKPFAIAFPATWAGALDDVNAVSRVRVGESTATATVPTQRCIGLEKRGSSAVDLVVHDGTNSTYVTSSSNPAVNVTVFYEIVSDGSGNVTLFANGTSVATTANGPKTAGSASQQNIYAVAENINALTGTQVRIIMGNPKIVFDY
jgi:hypothetical protein